MRPPLRHVPSALLLRTARSAPAFWVQQQLSHLQFSPLRAFSTTSTAHHDPHTATATTTTSSPSSSSSSVNEAEISHFSALASSWWDPHGPSRPLHLMNPLRHEFIQSCLASSPIPPRQTPEKNHDDSSSSSSNRAGGGLHYLDVGCGGGIFAESAARLPGTASVTGVDPSPAILAVARAHAKRDPALAGKLRYVGGTIEELPLPAAADPAAGRGFDVVTLFEVVEHVDYPAAFLDRVGDFVRPGGWLVLSTIARTWTSWLTTNVVAEDILRLVPRGTHDWYKYINEDELRAYFAAKGGVWGVPRVMGVVYVPGLGWKEVKGSEKIGNYFFGVQKVG